MEITLGEAIIVEIFFSIFYKNTFTLLSNIISKRNSKGVFWTLFLGRILILSIFDIFITPKIVIFDFFAVFGISIIVSICDSIIKIKNPYIGVDYSKSDFLTTCASCGAKLEANIEVCANCGKPISVNRIEGDTSSVVVFDDLYINHEKNILKMMIIEEFKNRNIDIKSFTTSKINKNKNILLALLGVISFVIVTLYYFNYPFWFCCLLETLLFIVYMSINSNFRILNILTKTLIKNPNDDISNVVDTVLKEKKSMVVPHRLKVIIVVFMTVFIPTITFFNPKVIYTKYGNGYQIFRYTRGIRYEEEVTIPADYKGKKVLAVGERAFKNSSVKKVNLPKTIESIKTEAFRNANNIEKMIVPAFVFEIRANAFADMQSLTYVSLPEGLKDIRAGAFANDVNLTNIKLPNSLEYLGARAFSHCSSITEITIPKKVTEINGQTFEYMTSLKKINLHNDITNIHGETFKGDTSLDNVILPNKIKEIRGNTFENCSSLTSIKIPNGVTRIGGHAFHGCSSLSRVVVPKTVKEIGSSAFRKCSSLYYITLPKGALVNERAFKESPTEISYFEE